MYGEIKICKDWCDLKNSIRVRSRRAIKINLIITFVTNGMICNKFYDEVIVLAVCSGVVLQEVSRSWGRICGLFSHGMKLVSLAF